MILYARDISRIISLEKESTENKYKSVLLRTVSHELRTPTNAMLNITRLLKESNDLSKENKENLNIIYCSCTYLLCLINDLLDYSQIMAGCLKIVPVKFDLIELISDCLKLVEMQVGSRPISIQFIQNAPTPINIVTDPNRLKQILLNLLGNSLKFTQSGTITLELSYLNKQIKFNIKDTGIGIPSNKLNHIFKQFGKVEETTSMNPQGAGLGLFISNMLAYKLGGNGIEVHSKEGSGSCFSFNIITKEEIIEEKSDPIVRTGKPLHKRSTSFENDLINILIVDDTYFNILAYQKIFDSEGYKCDYAGNGKEAIIKIKEKKYDLVFMDCEMPILNGWATTAKLKKIQKKGKIALLPPIIGNTSYNDDDIRDTCINSGMDDVIIKPCPKEELISKVHFWISASKMNNS